MARIDKYLHSIPTRKAVVTILFVNESDITDITPSIRLQSRWNDGADILTFEYPTKNGPRFENGSTVIFTYGGANIFYGFLFKTKQDKKKYTCTAYDQLRYFKANYTLMRQIETLDSFLNRVAYTVNDRVRLGTVDKTEIKLGKYFFDNKELLDMLYQSIKDNLLLNGYQYTLRDNFGALDLRDTYDLRLPLVLGDNSLATDFSYTRSIDDSTYNYIKVAKDDQAAGVRNTYIAQDSKTIGTDTEGWGRLILYHKVSGDLNDEQLAQRANQLLYLHNEETRTLTIDAIGDTRIRGGSGVKVEIASAGLDMWAVADSVNHEFTGKAHTMKIDLIYGEKELWELRS